MFEIWNLEFGIWAKRWFPPAIRAVFAAFVMAAPSAAAQPDADIQSRLTQVVAPSATCSAISDELDLLLIGRRQAATAELAVFRLGKNGAISDKQPTKTVLPKPASLEGFPNYPLGIAFHPRLPLVYVWQDITGPEAGAPQQKTVHAEFDHLILFGLTNGTLQQVGAFARGEAFAYSQNAGAIAVCPLGLRMFLPNLRVPEAKEAGRAAIGYYDLDEFGMPKPMRMPIPGTLDGYGINKFDLRVEPITVHLGGFVTLPTGLGFIAPSKTAVVFSGVNGPAVWDTENRRGALGFVPIKGVSGPCFIGSHTQKQIVYGAVSGGNAVFAVAHSDGYPTLLPEVTTVADARFHSAPVAVAETLTGSGANNSGCLAIGGVNRIHIIPLNNEGRFTGTGTSFSVAAESARAISYSKKHDKLYVAVEKTP